MGQSERVAPWVHFAVSHVLAAAVSWIFARGLRGAVPPFCLSQVGRLRPSLMLLQYRDNLLFVNLALFLYRSFFGPEEILGGWSPPDPWHGMQADCRSNFNPAVPRLNGPS